MPSSALATAEVDVYLCTIPLFEGVVDHSGSMQSSVGFDMLRRALGGLPFLPAAQQMLEEAVALRRSSLRLAPGAPEELAKDLNNLGIAYLAAGDARRSLLALEEAETIFRNVRPRVDDAVAGVRANLALVHGLSGRAGSAEGRRGGATPRTSAPASRPRAPGTTAVRTRVEVFGSTQTGFVTQPSIKVYWNGGVVGRVHPGERFVFDIEGAGEIRFRYALRSARLRLDPTGETIGVRLSWNRSSGKLVAARFGPTG